MALAHAILAFLVDRSSSGYELTKQFNESVGFFWQASHQQIYRELSKLEDRGWVTFDPVPQAGRPDKKLYRVTAEGQKELTEWIGEPCEPPPGKEDLLVKIFAGHLVDTEILLAELERHRQIHLEQLSIYQQIEEQYFGPPERLDLKEKLSYLTLRRGIRYEMDCVAWCDEAIAMLS
ncbi:MAG: PadR family transcriptional regulator [Cyanosarcina radialis HA8281-LM2]|nr:PadR family transcriptional regulator [Cyanosarcina radialis HA8281-LM2]